MKKLPLKEILKTIGVFALGMTVVIGVAKSVDYLDEPDPVVIEKPVERSVVDCPEDFASFEEVKKKKNLVLVANQRSYAKPSENNFVSTTVTVGRENLKSQIACGYLFYRVSVGGRAIRQDENFFMGLLNQYGGHIFSGHILPSKGNWIVNREVNNKTEVLIPLNEIVYDGTDRKNLKTANWVSLLNVADSYNFEIALNTISHLGNLDLVEIAYKCWNPRTGEETDDCSLVVEK